MAVMPVLPRQNPRADTGRYRFAELFAFLPQMQAGSIDQLQRFIPDPGAGKGPPGHILMIRQTQRRRADFAVMQSLLCALFFI